VLESAEQPIDAEVVEESEEQKETVDKSASE
jgi:hypothetical protein